MKHILWWSLNLWHKFFSAQFWVFLFMEPPTAKHRLLYFFQSLFHALTENCKIILNALLLTLLMSSNQNQSMTFMYSLIEFKNIMSWSLTLNLIYLKSSIFSHWQKIELYWWPYCYDDIDRQLLISLWCPLSIWQLHA